MAPDFRAYVRQHLPALAIRPERELEIVDELALQLEAAYEAARRDGASHADAWARACTEVPDWSALAATLTRIETPVRQRPPSTPHFATCRRTSARGSNEYVMLLRLICVESVAAARRQSR